MKSFRVVIFLALVFVVSCANVQGFEKMRLNDEDMSLSERDSKKFETTFQTYREGSSGANGGKSGGGCGCN